MVRSFGQNRAVLLKEPQDQPLRNNPRPPPVKSRFGLWAFLFSLIASLFWFGSCAAFMWGYWGPKGLLSLNLQTYALLSACALLPPLFFIAVATAFARGALMSAAADQMLRASERLFAADEQSADDAATLARIVRRELDGLNTGLEVASQRMRSMEAMLEKQISTLEDAGARAQLRGETIAARLHQESQRLEALGEQLSEAASRAGETVAGRSAQLKTTMESAEGTLKMATQLLDVQAAGFRSAVTAAAELPYEAAKSLDAQAGRIEEVANAAMSRAEFVLARQEKHRSQMGELAQRLKQEGELFESVFSQQRAGMEQAVSALSEQAKRIEDVTGDAERHLALIMTNATERANQLSLAFADEAQRLRQTGEAANAVLMALGNALKDASAGAQTLIAESAAQAKHDARSLVGEAMGQCEQLLRAAGEMSAEANKVRALLNETTRDVEKHLVRLPALAQEEARRVRQLMASETEQLLDLSARTLSTLYARSARKPPPSESAAPQKQPAAVPDSEGLKGLARKLTARQKRKEVTGDAKAWEMKALLAAAEQNVEIPATKADKSGLDVAAVLGTLELAVADMAIDLSALDDTKPSDEDWKRYLAGDRAVFARRLADAIDSKAVDRITRLYRDDAGFHEAADAYLEEFEAMLARARAGDGGGLLTSTLLSADTGKVYLTIAYALGRL